MRVKKYPKISGVLRRSVPQPKNILELSDKQKKILKTTSQIILAIAIFGGALTVAAMAPNAFKALELFESRGKRPRNKNKKEVWQRGQQKIRQSLYYLRRTGQIHLIPKGPDDFLIEVTKKGRELERRLQFAELQVKSVNRWDGTWWVVIADVPVQYRHAADQFREKITEMKFYPLQRTVWFYPFDPRDEIDFVSAYFQLERFVTYMRAFDLDEEDEKKLKQHFRSYKII